MSRKTSRIDMCNGPILPGIIAFSLPLILSGCLQLLFNAADVIVVGRFAGNESLAAVGSTSSLTNLLVNLFIGLSIGANVTVGHTLGSRDEQGTRDNVHTAVTISLISGFVLIGIGILFTRPLLVRMGAPSDVLDKAALYLKIIFIGMPATMAYNFGSAILRATGDTKRPLYFLSVAGVVNVILNLFFCYRSPYGCGGSRACHHPVPVHQRSPDPSLPVPDGGPVPAEHPKTLYPARPSAPDDADRTSRRNTEFPVFFFQRADPVLHQLFRIRSRGRQQRGSKYRTVRLYLHERRSSGSRKLYQPEHRSRKTGAHQQDPVLQPWTCHCHRTHHGYRRQPLRNTASVHLLSGFCSHRSRKNTASVDLGSLLFMRHHGSHHGNHARTRICHHAHDRSAVRRMSVPDCMACHCICMVPYSKHTASVLSCLLDPDCCHSCADLSVCPQTSCAF